MVRPGTKEDVMSKTIACTLGVSDLSEQRSRWFELAGRTRVERSELPTGLRLVFGEAPGVGEALEQLVDVERECCAFADWELNRGEGESTLDITAQGDAIDVVQGMFSQLEAVTGA
jgi:hypothetical protein